MIGSSTATDSQKSALEFAPQTSNEDINAVDRAGAFESFVGSYFGNFENNYKRDVYHSRKQNEAVENLKTSGETLNPDQIQSEFGFTPKEPLSRGQAAFLQKENESFKEINDGLKEIPDGFFKTLGSGAASVTSGFADWYALPFNIALSFGSGVALKSLKLLPATIKGKLLAEFGENVVGSLITEQSAKKAAEQRGEDYDLLTNVALGAAVGTAATVGLEHLFKSKIQKSLKPNSKTAVDKIQSDILAQGVDPEPMLGKIDAHVKEQIQIDDKVKKSLVDTFGEEKAAKMLDGAEDILDIRERVGEEIKMLPEESQQLSVDAFMKSLNDNGYDKVDLMDKGEIDLENMPEHIIEDIHREVTTAKQNPEMPFVDKEEVYTDYERFMIKRSKELDEQITLAKQNEAIPAKEKAEFEAMKEEEVLIEKDITYQKAYTGCLLKGAK